MEFPAPHILFFGRKFSDRLRLVGAVAVILRNTPVKQKWKIVLVV